MKKKLTLLGGLLVLLFCLGACRQTDDYRAEEHRVRSFSDTLSVKEAIALKIKQTGTTRVSEQEALRTFEAFASRSASKSGVQVASVQLMGLSDRLSKSSSSEAPFCYLIEFSEGVSRGYSLVSADRRVSGVLAYTERGTIADTATNNGVKLFVERLARYMAYEILSFNTDSLYAAVSARHAASKSGWIEDDPFRYLYIPNDYYVPDLDFIYQGEVQEYRESESSRPHTATQWGQGDPFNRLLPVVGTPTLSGRAYAGCEMVAVAQIMAYHKKSYGSISTTDWDALIANKNHPKLSALFLDLYNNMKTEVSSTGTSSTQEKAIEFLRSCGYNTFWRAINYDYNAIAGGIGTYGPVMVRGQKTPRYGSPGHAWVIDGTSDRTSFTYDMYEKDDGIYIWRIMIRKLEEIQSYVHCNWGYSGVSDGWFRSQVFTLNANSSYNYELKIIAPIY